MLSRRAFLLGSAALAGCDRFPRDSAGALDRILRERRVRLLCVSNPPWVTAGGTGLEVELVRAWAASLDARVVTRTAPLHESVDALHRREADVLVAGLVATTPYSKRLGLSQPYLKVRRPQGETEKRVMAVVQGESALLLSLDRFLQQQDEVELRRRVGAQAP